MATRRAVGPEGRPATGGDFLIQIKHWGTIAPTVRSLRRLRAHLRGAGILAEQIHPLAPHHMPFFISGPDGSDTLMVVMGFFLVGTVLWVGTLYWRLHSLPERMAHKSQKLQFEIVAVLGLISLFTHMHIFWIAGLLLAMIDLPDFGTPMRSIAGSVERIADATPGAPPAQEEIETAVVQADGHGARPEAVAKREAHGHA